MAPVTEAPVGDVNSGEKIFKANCAYCHTVDKGAGHKKGPNLHGLFGKRSGTAPGYSYSATIKDVIWDESTLYEYLVDPKKYTPVKKWNFHNPNNPQERADLIAYLKKSTA